MPYTEECDRAAFSQWLRHTVRAHLLLLMGVQDLSQLPRVSPTLTDREYDEYFLGFMPQPTVQHFRIDFERPWQHFAFNRAACAVFCKDLIRALEVGHYDFLSFSAEWQDRVRIETVKACLNTLVSFIQHRYF